MNISKEKLHVRVTNVDVSKSVETSVQVSAESIADVNDIQSLLAGGGQTKVVLFLRNMAARVDELQQLVGKEFDVLHFKVTVLDLTEGANTLVYTGGYEQGLSALTWNTANLDTTNEDAAAVIKSQFDARLNDGTYSFDALEEDEEDDVTEPEEEEPTQKAPQRLSRPQRPNRR